MRKRGRRSGPLIQSSNRIGYYGDDFTCRGLARRTDPKLPPGQACRKTIYEATLDGRLIAVDAETGKACAGFGTAGRFR